MQRSLIPIPDKILWILHVKFSNQGGSLEYQTPQDTPVHESSFAEWFKIVQAIILICMEFHLSQLWSSLIEKRFILLKYYWCLSYHAPLKSFFSKDYSHNQRHNNVFLQPMQLFPINNITYFITMVVFFALFFFLFPSFSTRMAYFNAAFNLWNNAKLFTQKARGTCIAH